MKPIKPSKPNAGGDCRPLPDEIIPSLVSRRVEPWGGSGLFVDFHPILKGGYPYEI